MKRGSKPLDMTSLREMFADGRVWSGIGVVRARDGDGSHFKKVDDDVLVDVDLSPRGAHVWCRLGSAGGGEGIGIWRIPPVGTEVGVILPEGHPGADPIIACTLSSGGTPDGLDGDVLLLVNSKKVAISSTDEDVGLTAGDGKIVSINGTDYKLPKWDDFFSDFVAWATQVETVINALVTPTGIAVPAKAAWTTYAALPDSLVAKKAIDTNYKSDKAKNG